jgi:hypothetical protein
MRKRFAQKPTFVVTAGLTGLRVLGPSRTIPSVISRWTGNCWRPLRSRAYLDCPGLSEMMIVVIHARANSNFCVIASSVKPNRSSFERSSDSLCSEQASRLSSTGLRSRSSPGPVLVSPSEVVTVVPRTVHTAEKRSPPTVLAAITRRSEKSMSWLIGAAYPKTAGAKTPPDTSPNLRANRPLPAVRVRPTPPGHPVELPA